MSVLVKIKAYCHCIFHTYPYWWAEAGDGKASASHHAFNRWCGDGNKARRESQFRFWSRFGVTQSRGSRFEMGTEIPPPIAILRKLYFDGTITDGDLLRAKRKPNRAYAVLEEMRIASVQMQG